MTTKTKAILTGDTFRFRGILKDHGWKWDPDAKAWTKEHTWKDEDHVITTIRGYGGIRNRGTFDVALEEV